MVDITSFSSVLGQSDASCDNYTFDYRKGVVITGGSD